MESRESMFNLLTPKTISAPILISSPHSGTEFPEELTKVFQEKFIETPEDTDWHIPLLYDFAADLGIPMISAKYSRYVIDLNRQPENQKLYSDGRPETAMVPLTSFAGEELYKENNQPSAEEIQRRKKQYYDPYYRKIAELLGQWTKEFGKALLFDAHSIKHLVPSIQSEAFPQLILGSNDGKSADQQIIDVGKNTLSNSQFSFSHNSPFKGGHITRHFGQPNMGLNALQLEMCQNIYMNEDSRKYIPEKARDVRPVLTALLKNFVQYLQNLQ